MNSLLLVCLYLVMVRYACCRSMVSSSQPSPVAEDGEPLILTPLILAGGWEKARNLSRVEPLIDDVESYAGYLTIDEPSESHLYFWFFPKTTPDNGSAPLILWLRGDPGDSSLRGLFCENGPYRVVNNTLKRRVHAWTNNYHVLYIDQPVGSGYSFTKYDGYIDGTTAAANDLYTVLLQFFLLFPELSSHDLYIAGESYAGKYIPALGHIIHKMNGDPRVLNVRLKGFIIRNAFSDPENMLEFVAPLRMLGLLDRDQSRQMELMQDEVIHLIKSQDWLKARKSHIKLLKFVSNVDDYLPLFKYEKEERNDDSYVEFVTKEAVRQRIHVGDVQFNAKSVVVWAYMQMDYMQSVKPLIEELLEYYPMVFYSSGFNLQSAPWMTKYFLEELNWSGAAKYAEASNQAWIVGSRVAGDYKIGGNLTYVSVYNGGDEQLMNALSLVDTFIGNRFSG